MTLRRMRLFENFDPIVTGRGTYLKLSVLNMQYTYLWDQWNHALHLNSWCFGHFKLKFWYLQKFSMHSVPFSVHSVRNFLSIDKTNKRLGQRLSFDPKGSKNDNKPPRWTKKFVLKKKDLKTRNFYLLFFNMYLTPLTGPRVCIVNYLYKGMQASHNDPLEIVCMLLVFCSFWAVTVL